MKTQRPKKLLPQKTPATKYYTCSLCGQNKNSRAFYKSYAEENKTGYIPICKDCIKKKVIKKGGEVDLDKLKEILKNPLVDKPFFAKTWQAAQDSKHKDKVGEYFRLISIPDYQKLRWANSDRENRVTPKEAEEHNKDNHIEIANPEAILDTNKEEVFPEDIPDEIAKQWGYGYEPQDYLEFNNMYNYLKEDYQLDSGMAVNTLKEYIINSVLSAKQKKIGDPANAKRYADMMEKNLKSPFLRRVVEDEGKDYVGGLWVEELEKTNKFIPRFPDIIMDDIDMILFCYINYIRKLLGKEEFKLGEIKETIDFNYTAGQEIYLPSTLDKQITDKVMYEILYKYYSLNKEQFKEAIIKLFSDEGVVV